MPLCLTISHYVENNLRSFTPNSPLKLLLTQGSGATKFDFPPYSNLVAGFISNIRRFDVPPRRFDIPPHKFDFMWFVCLYIEYVHEYVQGA